MFVFPSLVLLFMDLAIGVSGHRIILPSFLRESNFVLICLLRGLFLWKGNWTYILAYFIYPQNGGDQGWTRLVGGKSRRNGACMRA